MSFDIHPQDKNERILWYHPESDCYGICKSRAEFESYCNGEPIDDVTDIEHHEQRWLAEFQDKHLERL